VSPPTREPIVLKKQLSIELEKESRREKGKGGKQVGIEEGKEREKGAWENRKRGGKFRKWEMISTGPNWRFYLRIQNILNISCSRFKR
jgi:hypothetical protein